MGIDERRVRAKFIQLLRQRTPDHPWVKTHDRKLQEAVMQATATKQRRYILVHTHPENLIISPLEANQFAAKPLTLGPPIESRLFSLQRDLFTEPAIVAALADPAIEVVCLCLRTSDRYGEAKRLGMTVVEVRDSTDAFWRADDRLPHEEEHEYPADGDLPAYTGKVTNYRQRED